MTEYVIHGVALPRSTRDTTITLSDCYIEDLLHVSAKASTEAGAMEIAGTVHRKDVPALSYKRWERDDDGAWT